MASPPDDAPGGSRALVLARRFALGALVAAIVAAVLVSLGGSGPTTYHLRFLDAGQLVKGDDVQIGGRRVGDVTAVRLANDNQADIEIALDGGFTPLRRGLHATIRAKSLSGQANHYVALTPGPSNAPALGAGTVIPSTQTTSPVTLDTLFDTFDPKTRRNLDRVIHGSSVQYAGKGAKANASAHYFNPAISASSRLVNELDRDQQAFTDFIVQSSKVVTAIAARRGDLAALVGNAHRTAHAVAAESGSLSRALGDLPTTLRRSNTTFVNLRATLDDLGTLVAAAKPATRRLAPFLADLRPLVHAAIPTIHDLRTLIRQPGSSNDLLELLRKTPSLERAAKPAFGDTVGALQKSDPVLKFIRPYTPELVGWLRDFGEGTTNYDANGHYARIQPIFNLFQLADNGLGLVLNQLPPGARPKGLQTGFLTRCPGAATQPPADHSAPFRDADGKLDCNPAEIP